MPEMTPLEAAKTLEHAPVFVWVKRKPGFVPCGPEFRSGKMTFDFQFSEAVKLAASYLRKIAAGEYKPVVHAHWEEVEPGHDILFRCSKCGRIISTSWGSCEDDDTQGYNGCDPTDEWLSCPTCGCPMDGKDDSHV